jgi:hypothetical protein
MPRVFNMLLFLCYKVSKWRWLTIDVPPSSLDLVLRWLLFYLFCSSIVINAVISDSTHLSLEMPVPSQGHYGFHSFPLVTDFVCLYTYEFWLSLWKIVRSSVICYYPYLFITQHANYQIHKDHLVLGYQYKRELTLCYMYYSKSNWQLNNKLQNSITLRMHAHLSTQEIISCTGEVYSSRYNIMW